MPSPGLGSIHGAFSATASSMEPALKQALIAGGDPLAAANPSQPSARWALAALSLAMLLPSLGASSANVALPALMEAFAASFQQAQWVVLAYLLAITVLVVSVGRLGDLIGRRRLLLVGLILFTAASALCGAADSLNLLIAARIAQGLGAAILMALPLALVGEITPKGKTGAAMGLLGTMSAIGTALGPSLGGALIAGFGWRAIFLVNLPLGLLALLFADRFLPAAAPAPRTDRPGFDVLGTLLLGASLAAYALALTIGRNPLAPLNLALLLAAAVGGGVFIWVETRTASPLIRPAALRDATLSAGLAMNALVSTVMMATLVVGPFYLAYALGLHPALVGAVMSLGPILAALSGVFAGRLVDRFGAPQSVTVGLIGMAVGTAALATLPERFGLAGYGVAIALLTPAYQLFQAANNTAIMQDVGANQRGVVSGMLTLSRNLGLITGAAALGALFALASGTNDGATASADAVTAGLRTTFIVATLLILVALGIATARRAVAQPAPLTPDETDRG